MRSIISVFLLIIAGTVFFLYTKPSYDSLQGLTGQSAQYDAALSKAAQLQSIKQSLLSRYNSFDAGSIARLQTMLPDQVDNIRLILDLDNIAGRYGMALQNVDISTPTSGNTTVVGAISAQSQEYDALTLHFTTRGTYDQFKQFLKDLESSLRIVDLETLQIAHDTGTPSSEPIYSYTMSVQTYWLK